MQQSLWIIDGNNCIGRDATLAEVARTSGRDAAARILRSQLGIFRNKAGRGHAVALVFDGVVGPTDEDVQEQRGLRVLRPRPGQNADAIVLEEARRHEGRMRVVVVTSDRSDIGSRLRGLRVEWLSVEEFSAQLWPRTTREGAAPEATEKPRAPRDAAEVADWMRRFAAADEADDGKTH
ncbi:MAG: NYN domain-containing protein [Planctomycetota bacterium]